MNFNIYKFYLKELTVTEWKLDTEGDISETRMS